MENIIDSALKLLKEDESFVLATVISDSGSTPRGAGAKMIIRENEEIFGTVGGGLVEAKVQKLAKKVFKRKEAIKKEFVLTQDDVAKMDMICGGEAKVYLQYVDADNSDYLDIYQAYTTALEEDNKQGWLLTLLSTEIAAGGCNQSFLRKDGTLIGDSLVAEKSKLEKSCKKINNTDFYVNNNQEYMIEAVGNISKVYIYGGGHVGYKLAPLLKYVGFYTVVLDDREKFANRDRFSETDEVIVLDSFTDVLNDRGIDQDSYIIIVTRGHKHDKTVLSQALKTDAGYIGMIGSLSKRNQIYDALLEEGFSKEELEAVYSPIGIGIKAETPAEIGVSITGELIRVRAEKRED